MQLSLFTANWVRDSDTKYQTCPKCKANVLCEPERTLRRYKCLSCSWKTIVHKLKHI